MKFSKGDRVVLLRNGESVAAPSVKAGMIGTVEDANGNFAYVKFDDLEQGFFIDNASLTRCSDIFLDGDRVVLKQDAKEWHAGISVGERGTVRRVDGDGIPLVRFDSGVSRFVPQAFLDVADKRRKILITVDGQKVTAKDIGKGVSAEAKCSPDDEFDLATGISIAVKRLEEKVEPKYWSGKVVCTEAWEGPFACTTNFTAGKVYTVDKGEIIGDSGRRFPSAWTAPKTCNERIRGPEDLANLRDLGFESKFIEYRGEA